MNKNVGCIGDLLVEIMRKNIGESLDKPGIFLGPYASGASGIFIDSIARLGIDASFIGAVGNDDFGKLILKKLKSDGVDISSIKTLKKYTTGVAFVTYFGDGNRKFIYHITDAATGQIYPEDIIPEFIKKFDYLHIVGSTISINKNCKESIKKAIQIVIKNGGKITFDPNLRKEIIMDKDTEKLFDYIISESSILFPTEEELLKMYKYKNIDIASEKLLSLGPDIIAVKRGEKGSKVYTQNDRYDLMPYKVKAVDPTGAGDCYCAGFITGIIRGMEVEEAGEYANAVAAISTTKKGPMEGAPLRDEVQRFLRSRVIL